MSFKFERMGTVFLEAVEPGVAVFFFSDPMLMLLALMTLFLTLHRVMKAGVKPPVLNPEQFQDLDLDHSAWHHKDAG